MIGVIIGGNRKTHLCEREIEVNVFWVFFNGILMGIANVIPGLSGGTLLLLTGIYPRFIQVFSSMHLTHLRAYRWRENGFFILLIGFGALISIFAMSKVMSWVLDQHPVPVYLLLIGLIIGSIDIIVKKIHFKSPSNRYAMLAGIGVIICLMTCSSLVKQSSFSPQTIHPVVLILAGIVAAATMVLPGVSGSMLLFLMGLYKPIVDSVSALNIMNILFIGLGAVAGILVASKMIKWLLEHAESITYAFLFGLIIASLIDLFPLSVFKNYLIFIIGIIAFIFGIILGKGLKRLEKKYSKENY